MPRPILPPLLERRIGERAREADGIGIVLEVDAPTAAREVFGVERYAASCEEGAGCSIAVTHPRVERDTDSSAHAPRPGDP